MIAVVLAACGGFLLGVLWMDLMFDVQVRASTGEGPISSIAAYYRRVTTDAAPMSRLIAGVMVVQLCGIAAEVLLRRVAGWSALAIVALGAGPIGLALARIVPDAVRLGSKRDAPAMQRTLARRIYHAHVLCAVAIAAFVALQIRLACR